MKKALVCFLVLGLLASVSFAAKAPVSKYASSGKALALGTSLGFPALRYQFNNDFTGSLGAWNASGGGASATAILVKVDYAVVRKGQTTSNIGAFYTTNGAAAATTSFGLTYGVGAMVSQDFVLGVDAVLLNSISAAGTSFTGILGPAIVGLGIPGFGFGVTVAATYYL